MSAGDYRRFRPKIVQIGSIETETKFTKRPNWRAFVGFTEFAVQLAKFCAAHYARPLMNSAQTDNF